MILNKVVKRYGKEGMIQMPSHSVGQEFYVVSKDDMDRTYELLDRSMIKQKVYEIELEKMKSNLETFRNMSNARLTYLEKIVSLTTEKKEIE